LPTHNGVRYLRQSVESCLSQTHRELELIVVDDGSTDGTPEMIASFDDPRIVRVRNDPNLGLPASLNVGFTRARGDYLTWTSDDNWYELNALERMLDFLAERKAQFVRSDLTVHSEGTGEPDRRVELPDEVDFEKMNPVHSCFLYHRSVRDAVGDYDVEAVLAEDYDYWIRVSKKFLLHRMAEPLYHYRWHPGSLTARSARDRGQRIAAGLVRVKNHVTDIEGEAYSLAEHLSWSRHMAKALPVRAAGKLLRILSGGHLELARLNLSASIVDCMHILRDYTEGKIRMPEAARRLAALFAASQGA